MNLFNRILSILLAALIAAPAAFAHQDSQMAPANSYTARLSGYMPKKVQNFMDSWNKPDETKTETAWFYERIQLYMKSLVGYKLTATEYAQIRSRSSLDASVAIILTYVAAIYGIPKYGKTIFEAVQPPASKGLGAVSARYKKLSKKAFETYLEFQTWKNKKPEDQNALFLNNVIASADNAERERLIQIKLEELMKPRLSKVEKDADQAEAKKELKAELRSQAEQEVDKSFVTQDAEVVSSSDVELQNGKSVSTKLTTVTHGSNTIYWQYRKDTKKPVWKDIISRLLTDNKLSGVTCALNPDDNTVLRLTVPSGFKYQGYGYNLDFNQIWSSARNFLTNKLDAVLPQLKVDGITSIELYYGNETDLRYTAR